MVQVEDDHNVQDTQGEQGLAAFAAIHWGVRLLVRLVVPNDPVKPATGLWENSL